MTNRRLQTSFRVFLEARRDYAAEKCAACIGVLRFSGDQIVKCSGQQGCLFADFNQLRRSSGGRDANIPCACPALASDTRHLSGVRRPCAIDPHVARQLHARQDGNLDLRVLGLRT